MAADPYASLGEEVSDEAATDKADPPAVSDQDFATQSKAMFDQGASRADLDRFAAEHGRPAFGDDLTHAIDYRDKGGKGAQFVVPKAEQAKADDPYKTMGEIVTPPSNNLSGLSDEEVLKMFDHLPDGLKPGLNEMAGTGMLAGLDTEAASLAGAAGNAIFHPLKAVETGGQSIVDSYHDWRRQNLARIDYVRLKHPELATAAEITGAIANPIGAEAKGLGMAATAGGYGAVHGFTTGQGDVSDRGLEAGKEGVISAVAAPVVSGLLRVPGLARSAKDTVMGGSPSLARRIIAKAIKADENTGGEVGGKIAAANANDVPMMIADTGENARGLLAATGRSSGPARTIARDALEVRQSGLAERVTNAIERDLGPIANPHHVADTLMTSARDKAAPLYDAAYARAGADAFATKVRPLLGRPSMQKALARARRIAAEEGRDPTTLGFDLDQEGNTVLTRVPSWQTMDYVKRGMDDVVESYRDPTSGKLNLDTEGRAINNTLRTFLGAFDKANPDYAAARSVYAGDIRGVDAMNQGRKALNMTADDLEARIRDMTPFEKQMFALGARRAAAELIASKGDSANVINAITGTGKKRAMMARLFGDRPSFDRFVKTLDQEKEGFRTYARALHGSPTALNLEDDATLKLATAAADMALTGGVPITTAIRSALKFGVGKIGERTKKQVAALLSETDPAKFRDIADLLRKEAIRRGLTSRKINAVGFAGGKSLPLPAPQGQEGP